MEARIHRGAREVGGSCVELRSAGATLLLDLGKPLSAGRDDVLPLPGAVGVGVGAPGPAPLGVVISHGHADHWGLVPQLPGHVPVWWSRGTAAVLTAAAFWGSGHDCSGDRRYRSGEPFSVGPFTVTPHLADHSAYDAHSLLVEAGGRRLLYTGDLRAHGRKPGAFERVLVGSTGRVDAMLMEGTSLRDDGPDAGGLAPRSEAEVEAELARTLSETTGLVVVLASGQNVDRLVTTYRAARRAGRSLAVDLATADIAVATGRPTIPAPRPDWPHVGVHVPVQQRRRVRDAGAFERTRSLRGHRVFEEHLAADPRGWVLFGSQQSSLPSLLRRGLLDGGAVVWSMWEGYLREPRQQRLLADLARTAVPLVRHHTSGHAAVEDLRRLVQAVRPGALVPIHTDAPERYAEAFGPSTVVRADGTWWEV